MESAKSDTLLKITGLGLIYSGKSILKDVELDVLKGQVLSIIGPTGSGKTTLLRLINLLDEPSSGKIVFDGQTITGRSETEKVALRRQMAMVFQRPVMFRGNVRENVSYGLKVRGRESEALVKEALIEVGLSGYEKRDARTLSGGETQRIAIARALVLQPRLLLLDEPTANLDPKSANAIDSLLKAFSRRNTTIVLATHNMMQAKKLADRVAVLKEGRIISEGSPDDIFGNGTAVEQLLFETSVPW